MTTLRLMMVLSVMTLLSACAGTETGITYGGMSVEQAYLAGGTVAVPPYTRTIFSSNNF